MGNFTTPECQQNIPAERKICLQMKSRTSNIMFSVLPSETFSEIACRYGIEDHCPPGGCEMRYKGKLITATDTPDSLGMRCGDLVDVSW